MCGIAGIIGKNQNDEHLKKTLHVMKHRGPDATHYVSLQPDGFLGHNRLSIVDLDKRAMQPIWDHTHRYCLVFNGEIYNYRALRIELLKLGHIFKTSSDSEVLIEAWAAWGIHCISRLIGMFAFGVWDNVQKCLTLVRDRLGEKPLYYSFIRSMESTVLVFASELKGLIQHPLLSKNISSQALMHYLAFNYTQHHQSIFENVHQLAPACYLRYDALTNTHQIKCYWELSQFFKNKLTFSYQSAKERLNELLDSAVQLQMMADVPIGAFLSGGLDSSTVVSAMSRHANDKINTYSIGFRERSYDESQLSQKTAAHFSTIHYEKTISHLSTETLQQCCAAFDEPFADTSLIPMYLLCELASNNVGVALSGDGSDEIFGGYRTYQADRYYQKIRYFPAFLKKCLSHSVQYLPTSFSKLSIDYQIKQFFNGAMLSPELAHLHWREIFSPANRALLCHDYISINPSMYNVSPFEEIRDCHFLDQAMYVDIKTWLVDDILVKVDRTSMAHSLEVRAPFLDHRIVEFAAQSPVSYKIAGKQGKRILRDSQRHFLPKHVMSNSKKGFNFPISTQLSHSLFEMAYDITTSNQMAVFFSIDYIKRLWIEHQKRLCDNGHRLFNLLCFGLWYNHYN